MTDFPHTLPPLSLATNPETTRAYAALTQDWNPIHLEADAAVKAGFDRPIAHGTMALNLVVQAVAQGSDNALRIADLTIRFTAPTWVGQTLTAQANQFEGAEYEISVTADDGRVVMQGHATLTARNTDNLRGTE